MSIFDLFKKAKQEKPRADFSNVRSGVSSTAPTPEPVQEVPIEPTPPPERIYVVVSGDSLSKIAKREYGDARKWPLIFEANKNAIKDPNLIFPGQRLIIPEPEATSTREAT